MSYFLKICIPYYMLDQVALSYVLFCMSYFLFAFDVTIWSEGYVMLLKMSVLVDGFLKGNVLKTL